MDARLHDSIDPQLAALLGHSGVPKGIAQALRKAAGARFYKCALQVNPFEYVQRHAKPSAFTNEQDYNQALVAACVKQGIEVIGITDHFRVASSRSLATALQAAGICVFLGFEASSCEGVHLLCLFPDTTSINELERTVGVCGVTDLTTDSPQSDKTFEQLLELIPMRGGIVIAAHACSASGILTTLKGLARARAWKSEHLLAIALPGARSDVPEHCINIVGNKDPATARPRPVAVVNANDVSSPTALSDPSVTSWIKMADVSIEGLRQAFLDWESRIQLNSDTKPTAHTELIAACWAGGLLDGQCLRFNEGLNALVGGRGAGKSTLIESLRFAFGLLPKGEETRRTHESMIKSVLGQGASVHVLVRSPQPSPRYYLIERIYAARPRVRDETGELLADVKPESILGSLEVYGQHEISELTREPEKLAQLLRRFTEPATDATATKSEVRDELGRSRNLITSETTEISRIEDALAALPALKEQLKRFADAGLDAKLRDKTLIDQEARLFEEADKLAQQASELGVEISGEGMLEHPLVIEDEDLPNQVIIRKLNDVQRTLLAGIAAAGQSIKASAEEAVKSTQMIRAEWAPKQEAAEHAYHKALRELKSEGHDGDKFVKIKDQVERLRPKETELTTRKRKLSEHQRSRRELLAKWDDLKAQDFRELQKAARKVTRRLKDRVRVSVRRSALLTQLEATLRRHCSGNISQALELLRNKDDLSLSDLAATLTEGPAALVKSYGFSQGNAERISQGGSALALEIAECEIPAVAALELNVGSDEVQNWKQLDDLSTGQKATAVLLLLLLEADAPLIVDQPEDDLDNRFIADCVVPAMREEKGKRQFIFSTHNANIPVLGDAEQIVGLIPVVESGLERATIPAALCGSIDTPAVKDMVKELLEGGQAAFEFRRQKYGF